MSDIVIHQELIVISNAVLHVFYKIQYGTMDGTQDKYFYKYPLLCAVYQVCRCPSLEWCTFNWFEWTFPFHAPAAVPRKNLSVMLREFPLNKTCTLSTKHYVQKRISSGGVQLCTERLNNSTLGIRSWEEYLQRWAFSILAAAPRN